MKNWVKKVKDLLKKSLNPIPQELNELDWKISLSENNKRLNEHICAMANHSNGGYFVFGINDNGEYKGLSSEKIREIILKFTDLARGGIEPKLKVDHHIEQIENKNILFLYIKESPKKPVHIRGKGIEYTFIRSGASTRKADETEIAHLILNTKIVTFEEQIAETFEKKEELLEKIDYAKFFSMLEREIPTDNDKIIKELSKHQLVIVEDDRYFLTNLGVLTIAKNMSDFNSHVNRLVRILRYNDNSNMNANFDKEEEGGFVVNFNNIIKTIMGLLPKNEIIEGGFRKIISLYPEKLIRELVANAIIHQALKLTQQIRVEIFLDRIEITNPGGLPDNLKMDRMIDNSIIKNKLLAKTMFMMDICETRGSGIDKAFSKVEQAGLSPLEFFNSNSYFKVTISLPKTYAKMTTKEKMEACYQHCALRYMSKKFMTNSSLRERLKISPKNISMVSRLLKKCIENKKIKLTNTTNKTLKNRAYEPYWA